ncbi:MAG: type I pullulanase [Lachnospirales bacterium]
MLRTEGEYCYIISKRKVVLLLLEEIKNVYNVFIDNGSYQMRCNIENKFPVFFYNFSYYKYEYTFNDDLDITYKNYITFDDKEMFLDLAQYYKTTEFKSSYTYSLQDLGVSYNIKYTSFKVWSPVAKAVKIRIFEDDITKEYKLYDMQSAESGIWKCYVEGDLKNKFFLYEVNIYDEISTCIDIKCRATSSNGRKGLILAQNDTNPKGFKEDSYIRDFKINNAVIAETHIRDFSMNTSSNIKNKGKYLAFTENDTKTSFGLSTGVAHLKELGITHLQLLPVFDFLNVDEDNLDSNVYNWGYDIQNHNTPEGSYSLEPKEPTQRIKELKELVLNLHNNGIGVILDVVYTNIVKVSESNFQKLVPNYYFRTDNFGNHLININNENAGIFATERTMVRKHIIDSLMYWVNEYHIDGFRFQQMAHIDIDTLNEIRMNLDKIDIGIIMYGDGWVYNGSILRRNFMSSRENSDMLSKRIAFSSGGFYSKKNVFDKEIEYILGNEKYIEDVKNKLVGTVAHSEVDILKISENKNILVKEPSQTVNFTSIHEGLTLWDKIIKRSGSLNDEVVVNINKLITFINFLSQGVILFQLGEEFGRTKFGDENSYSSPDRINSINWDKKLERLSLFNYYKGLIAIRKSDYSFRFSTTYEIQKNVTFVLENKHQIVIKIMASNKKYDHYLILINVDDEDFDYDLEKKHSYEKLVDIDRSGIDPISKVKKNIVVKGKEAILLAYHK